ncbi:MAG: hypothetical protein V2I24_09455 [Halieaceae bacterium]|jgi:hypothetical protein|nr:hypothetical protein [Halieaceae bacterium]
MTGLTASDVLEDLTEDGWQGQWAFVPQAIDGHQHLVVMVSHRDAPDFIERFVCLTPASLPFTVNQVMSITAEMRDVFWSVQAQSLAESGELH